MKSCVSNVEIKSGEEVSANYLREGIFNLIKSEYPDFNSDCYISLDELNGFRRRYLSCLAAIQAPIIMMSQNRKEEKDRLRSENDYKINLKAELEIKLLSEKIDHMIVHQNKKLLEIQEIQTDYLQDLMNEIKAKEK
jgi:Protein of unknown function (DUF1003)